MALIDPLLTEFTHECASTRKLLEGIPEKDLAWKPHAKSMTLVQLASHLVETPSWVEGIVNQEEIVLDPSSYKPWSARSRAELLERFDKNVAEATAAMKGQPDDKMMAPWALKAGEQVIFQMPRLAALRLMILSHTIHHRGQLTVYLRLRDVPLPQIYGPTADEP